MTPWRQAAWLLARSPWDSVADDTRERLRRIMSAVVGEARFLQTIRDERLIPLARCWLRPMPEAAPLLPQLDRLYRRVVAYNLHLMAGWEAFTGVLARAGLTTVIPLKGLALAAWAYDDGALRQVEDLDAVIPAVDFATAVVALKRAGYVQRRGAPPGRDAVYIASLQDWLFEDPQGRLLDLKPAPIAHTLARPGDTRRLAARRTDVTVAPGRVWRAPDRVAMLILACMHGAHDGWAAVRHVADVAGLAARLTPVEWRELRAEAARWRQRRTVACGLELCRRLDVFTGGESGGARFSRTERAWLDRAVARLSGDAAAPLATRAVWDCEALWRDSLRDRWRCLWRQRMIPSASDWAATDQHHPLWRVTIKRLRRLWRVRRQAGAGVSQ